MLFRPLNPSIVHTSLFSAFALKHVIHVDTTHRDTFSDSCWVKPNFDCIYTFLIAMAPNIIPFGAKSIGKV